MRNVVLAARKKTNATVSVSWLCKSYAKSGGRFGAPRQMSADCGLADLSTELGEFAGMRATPQSGLVKLARRIGRLLIRHTMPHEAHRLR
jgi:hypothetical protein